MTGLRGAVVPAAAPTVIHLLTVDQVSMGLSKFLLLPALATVLPSLFLSSSSGFPPGSREWAWGSELQAADADCGGYGFGFQTRALHLFIFIVWPWASVSSEQ